MLPFLRTVSAALAFLVLSPPAYGWTWPAAGPVLQEFHLGADPYTAGHHRGIDVGGAAGAPVVAPRAGTVSFAGSVPSNGLSLTIETPDGYSVTLVHLGSIAVSRGARVAEGQAVASIGPTGTAEQSVPYLHLGIRTTADPNGYLDPLAFLPPRPPPAADAASPAPAVPAASPQAAVAPAPPAPAAPAPPAPEHPSSPEP
ncbi:MAG TPA: M23 family metallopeptidase, partial [Gaiellaceae bacterium]|nr:M23 family metallopeptidase [Gaiellaceae bacterium]